MIQYYDVTELVGLRFNSGIQRVVREVVGRAVATSDESAVPVVAIGGRFHRLTAEGREVLAGRGVPVPSAAPAADNWLKAALRRLPALFTRAQQLKFRRRMKGMRTVYETYPVVMNADDTLVLIDSFWSGGSALNAAAAARRRGVRIALIVYDLIPVNHVALVSREVAYIFPKAMARALRLATGVVAISRQAVEELLAYAPSLDPLRVTHAYLGHNFTPTAATLSATETFPTGLWKSDHTYLMVGTIEPRKGHDYVIEAFERLWAAGGDQTLLIIGKPGWHADDVLARCAAHPQRGRRLFLIHDASDQLLKAALARVDALIMASWLEGFGLPLVEALSAGRPVLASDIPVFREIAGDAASFFRCGDAEAVAATIREFEAAPDAALSRAQNFRWPNWAEATQGYLAAIERVLATAQKEA